MVLTRSGMSTAEPTIAETSETELFSSELRRNDDSQETDVSLDALFGALASKTKQLKESAQEGKIEEAEEENDDEVEVDDEEAGDLQDLSKVKKLLDNLPKLESKFEEKMAKDAQKASQKKDIVLINDPITAQRKTGKKEEPTDAGADWYHMKKMEITPEVKRDLMIIKNRSALDPKRHYKKDNWEIPKYFQMGTIIEGNTEFYSARMKRKDRGVSLVDEVLKDDKTDKYFKRKYSEITEKRKSGGKEFYQKLREKRRRY